MKNFVQSSICVIMALACIFSFSACQKQETAEQNLWEDALYLEDTTLGEGKTVTTVEVKAGEKAVTFTINTDKETVGAALLEHNLIEGENGLYTKVNGITADFDKDGAYWGFYVNGEYANEGMDTTKIENGKVYSLEYTK